MGWLRLSISSNVFLFLALRVCITLPTENGFIECKIRVDYDEGSNNYYKNVKPCIVIKKKKTFINLFCHAEKLSWDNLTVRMLFISIYITQFNSLHTVLRILYSKYFFFVCTDNQKVFSSVKIWICYYIDRCELWGFIREINSGIFTCQNISFFPAGTTFT